MVDIVSAARSHLKILSKQDGLTTGRVRKISSELYKELEDKSIDHVLILCEGLLEEREWALGVIAYDWAYRVRKQYKEDTFYIFEGWLKKYVTGWGDCDDFCTHAFGELLSQNNELFEKVVKWTEHPDFWVRRAAAVILIYPIKHHKYQNMKPFLIADVLMKDPHYLVLKGYGWMLKVLSQIEADPVYEYLKNNKAIMPRVSYRYALEKFDKDLKASLMEE
jgi:3-methyladenine DNA glycosylase AlkD